MHNFGPAAKGETVVFGAQRPGYSSHYVDENKVEEWIKFMKEQGIQRVCCLLDDRQLAYYQGRLLEIYGRAFGSDNLCHTPVADFTLCDQSLLIDKILPFLSASVAENKKIVVHCSGGIGRTGHILAAWLVHARGLTPQAAVHAVAAVPSVSRNPMEAVDNLSVTDEDLWALLESCR